MVPGKTLKGCVAGLGWQSAGYWVDITNRLE
jgi:hypothetical protein